jgi:hypothetical protein
MFYIERNLKEVKNAHFKSSAEVRAVNAVNQTLNENSDRNCMFNTMLMALIDYKGFRVIAHPDIKAEKVSQINVDGSDTRA